MKFLKINQFNLFGFLRFFIKNTRVNLRLLVIPLYIVCGSLYGQNIQVIMSNKPSPFISDWQEKTETASLNINNSSSGDIQVKVKAEIFDGQGTLVAYTDLSKMPVLIVPRGLNHYNVEDIFPSSAVNYKGKLGIATARTGRIPDDNYRFCVTLIDPQTGQPFGTSTKVCTMFNITAFQAPVLINPRDNDSISESAVRGIFFRWSPVIPSPNTFVTYRLQIWEVLEGQNSMTALRSNQPIVEKDLPPGILQTQWPIEFALPEAGRKYVWTVTPLDDQERKLVDGNGFAEPFDFVIIVPPVLFPGQNPTINLISPENGAEINSSKLNEVIFTWKLSDSVKYATRPDFYGKSYTLKLVEIKDGQSQKSAMQNNPPIMEIEGITTTMIKRGLEHGAGVPHGGTYAWSVKAGKTWDEGASQSEIWSFSIKNDTSYQRHLSFGWGIKFGKKSLSQCADFGICDIIISSASFKPDKSSAIGTFTALNDNTLEIKINKATGLTSESYKKYFSTGYFVFDEDFSFGTEIKEKLKMKEIVNVTKGKYKITEVDGIVKMEFGGGNIFYNTTCEEAKKDLEKKQNDLDSLKKELAGLGKRIRDTTIAKRDCEEELKNAEAELAAANAALQKQKDINKNIEQNTGPGKYWPDKDAAKKAHGDYEQALKDAQKAADDALAKVNILKERCPELTKALDKLKDKESTLPGDIARGEKAVTEAERTMEECIKEKDKCKEGEIRDAPGKSATTTTYLCATPGTEIKTEFSSNLDAPLAASTGLSDYLRKGLIIIKKIPVIGKMIKVVALPADLGVKILAAIPNAGMFGRIGLSSVSVVITIGPLHKFTLTKTDLEICKNGKWVPYDKQKCEVKDLGEVPSTKIEHTWKTGGVAGSELSELTAAGTGFREALAAAVQKLITDAVTPPEKLENEMKNCQ